MQASPGPATVVSKRLSLLSDDDAKSLLYARLDLIRRATSLCREIEKNFKLPQKRYKLHHDCPVRFATIFKEGDEVFLDRSSIFRSAAEKSAAEVYSKVFTTKQEPYMCLCVMYNTLQTIQDRLKITVFVHRATQAPNSWNYSEKRNGEEEGSTEDKRRKQDARLGGN